MKILEELRNLKNLKLAINSYSKKKAIKIKTKIILIDI